MSEILKLSRLKFDLEAKNCKVEIDRHRENSVWIGFCLKNNHVWHWISFVTDIKGIDNAIAEQSYSCNTGRTFKGWAHRLKIYKTITRLTGSDIQSAVIVDDLKP